MKKNSIAKASLVFLLMGALALIINGSLITSAVYGQGFEDVSLKHENVKAIEYLQTNGVVIGYEGGYYKPEQEINRAEFLKIVMEVSDYELGGEDCYPDVHDEWFAKYVCSATENGFVEGYPSGLFEPYRSINFAEASKIVANVLDLGAEMGDGLWYENFVKSLEEYEAVPESIEDFGGLLTRAQMAEMIWRIDADRTYKLSKTFDDIKSGTELTSELQGFESCQELHDYLEDNSDFPYYYEEYEVDAPSGTIPTAPMMAEKGGCFTAKTQISMADGTYKNIEDIKAGDKVLTLLDKDSSELVEAVVTNTVEHKVDGYLLINDELEVTPEHVLWVNGTWEVAGEVKVGDYMLDAAGEKMKVRSIEEVDKKALVYNFEVDNYHTYLANGYYVHNDKGGASQDYSSTNVQVQGVDEGDVIKNDGQYIYSLSYGKVVVTKAYPVDEMELVAEIDFENENFYPSDLYLDGDLLVVVGESYVSGYFEEYESKKVDPQFYYADGSVNVYLYDVSDKNNIELIRDLAVEGDYKTSRKVGDVLYLVATQGNYVWPWFTSDTWSEDDLVPLYVDDGTLDKMVSCEDIKYMPRQLDETNYTMMTAIPLDEDSPIDTEVILGSGSNVYASPENLYMVQEKYSWYGWYDETEDEEETYVHKFALNNDEVDYEGMGVIKGSVLNQFSMDEYNGNFRIATTVGDVWNEETPATNNVYVLNDDLQVVGSLEGLAEGERIYSARFMGDKGYIVTFKKVDPLFVLGLEDPSHPEVLGELKIPGYSDYLHPYDENHLIGFGLDTDEASEEEIEARGIDFAWYQGIKLAMFDVSDVNNPVQQHVEIIGDRGTHSELNYNHKALLWSSSKGLDGGALMAFPISVSELPEEIKNDPNTESWEYGETVFQGAYVYDVSPENGFTLRGTISHYDEYPSDYGYYWYGDEDISRIIYIGDYFYTVSRAMIQANEMYGNLAKVMHIDLPNDYE